MTILVKVTPEVLKRPMFCGFDGRPIILSCMLTEAFRDLFTNCHVVVDTANLLGEVSGSGDEITLPDLAIDKRRVFDSLGPNARLLMSPFSFEIEVPEYVISKIGLGEIYRVLSESKSLELVMPKEETLN